MEEKDYERLEKIVSKLTADFTKKLEDQSQDFHAWIGVQGEDTQHKLDLVVEGFQMLSEKIDRTGEQIDSTVGRLDSRLDRLEVKIDRVEININARIDEFQTEMVAHRANTELHRVPRKQMLKKAA